MKQVFYIGNNTGYFKHFAQLEDNIEQFDSMNYLISKYKKLDPNNLNIILLERTEVRADLKTLARFKQYLDTTPIFLITEAFPQSLAAQYRSSGITDTISPNCPAKEWHLKMLLASSYMHRDNPHVVYNFKTPWPKRLFDITVTSLALIAISPILLATTIIIKLESKGPVFYKSKRVGTNYQIFDFLKFRTMYPDADKRLKEYAVLNQYQLDTTEIKTDNVSIDLTSLSNLKGETILIGDDAILDADAYINIVRQKQDNSFVKLINDPRITKVGKVLRKYSIDELPQLINILKGDMSIVGNRPLPLYEAELLTKDDAIDRFLAPAGLTGLWQVEKRGNSGTLSATERKNLDIYYAHNFSFALDLKIILRTFTAFIQKENV